MKFKSLNQTEEGMDTSGAIQFCALSPVLGAEVIGLDIAKGIPDSVKPLLRKALLNYQVLLFRQQSLREEGQIQFAQIFGQCREMFQANHFHCNNKLTQYLSNVDRNGVPTGVHPDFNSTYWHSDGSHTAVTAKATVLYALQVPEQSGLTHFANMYKIYDDLDQLTRDRLAGYEAEHHIEFRRASRGKRMPSQWWQARKEGQSIRSQVEWWTAVIWRRLREGPVYHRVVRPHPETGRLALFIGDHAWRIKNKFWLTGIKLMNQINQFYFDPKAIYSHKWKTGDLLIWDNGSVLHRLGDYDLNNEVRIMRRCVVLPRSAFSYTH
jgi:taurine dioxygenase